VGLTGPWRETFLSESVLTIEQGGAEAKRHKISSGYLPSRDATEVVPAIATASNESKVKPQLAILVALDLSFQPTRGKKRALLVF
jgi:hypothetical protein